MWQSPAAGEWGYRGAAIFMPDESGSYLQGPLMTYDDVVVRRTNTLNGNMAV